MGGGSQDGDGWFGMGWTRKKEPSDEPPPMSQAQKFTLELMVAKTPPLQLKLANDYSKHSAVLLCQLVTSHTEELPRTAERMRFRRIIEDFCCLANGRVIKTMEGSVYVLYDSIDAACEAAVLCREGLQRFNTIMSNESDAHAMLRLKATFAVDQSNLLVTPEDAFGTAMATVEEMANKGLPPPTNNNRSRPMLVVVVSQLVAQHLVVSSSDEFHSVMLDDVATVLFEDNNNDTSPKSRRNSKPPKSPTVACILYGKLHEAMVPLQWKEKINSVATLLTTTDMPISKLTKSSLAKLSFEELLSTYDVMAVDQMRLLQACVETIQDEHMVVTTILYCHMRYTPPKGKTAAIKVTALRALIGQRSVLQSLVEGHNGHFHGNCRSSTGKASFVSTFDDPSLAMRCVVEAINDFKVYNSQVPSADQVFLQFGLHVGVVMRDENGNIYGDEVDVAAFLAGEHSSQMPNMQANLSDIIMEDTDVRKLCSRLNNFRLVSEDGWLGGKQLYYACLEDKDPWVPDQARRPTSMRILQPQVIHATTDTVADAERLTRAGRRRERARASARAKSARGEAARQRSESGAHGFDPMPMEMRSMSTRSARSARRSSIRDVVRETSFNDSEIL